jgi:hypothetical protein
LTLAPIGARAAFNPEEENPGQFNRVMDDKEKQEREAKFTVMKREQAQAEITRKAEAEANSRELAAVFQSDGSGTDWSTVNRWAFNLAVAGVLGALGWYGWKYTLPREQ